MLLQARGVVVRHHRSLPPVLAGVDLDIAADEIVAIVGSNGSGKSTLARALAGLVELESGSIVAPGGGMARVGLVLQDPAAQVVAVTVADELAVGPEARGHAPAAIARRVQDIAYRHGLLGLLHRNPSTLSGGQQQRVALAAIDACDVDVLVLDEPTAMLDRPARARLLDAIRDAAQGRGVAWITQEADEVAACDRVVVLDAGTVAWQGDASEYVAHPDLPATFGLELPSIARIAHHLRATGLITPTASVPTTLTGLLELLDCRPRHA